LALSEHVVCEFDRSSVTGYLNPQYAQSLSEFGVPHLLPRSRAWIVERAVPGFPAESDAMGLYPIFSCADWAGLRQDLDELGKRFVSLAVVTDPFGDFDEGYLRECFPDVMIPFKQHFVVDLRLSAETGVSRRHRAHARRASKRVFVERVENPADVMEEWVRLYNLVIARHHIRGVAAFSTSAFEKQLQVPGIVAFRAIHNDELAGMTLWYRQNDVAYWHLAGYSPVGYKVGASDALLWKAIQTLGNQVQWLSLGAGAGAVRSGVDGLSEFKKGWSSGTRTAYFCGRVFDRERYARIMRASGKTTGSYFPGYRAGEFQ